MNIAAAGDATTGVQHRRRLSDKILIAFHQACDQGDLEVASALLRVCETALNRPAPPARDRRRGIETLVAAHERLWTLRNPQGA